MASADSQWLFHSGELVIARGPFFLFQAKQKKLDNSCESSTDYIVADD